MYKSNPGLLAKLVREEADLVVNSAKQPDSQDVKDLYAALWGTKPNINPQLLDGNALTTDLIEALPTITPKNMKEKLARTKNNTAAGPDDLVKRDIAGVAVMEIMRL